MCMCCGYVLSFMYTCVVCLYVVKMYALMLVVHNRSVTKDQGDVMGGHVMQVQVKPGMGSYIAGVGQEAVHYKKGAEKVLLKPGLSYYVDIRDM